MVLDGTGNLPKPSVCCRGCLAEAFFLNSEILLIFDFNKGASEVFKDHLISYRARGGPPREIQYMVNLTFETLCNMNT